MGQDLATLASKLLPKSAPLRVPQSSPAQTESFRIGRPTIAGPDAPEEPYPIRLEGVVQHGFGRGSKDLGCPTANLPDQSTTHMASIVKPGVYYGYARVFPVNDRPSELLSEDSAVLPMVMSLGWNPFYKNQQMAAEIHIMREFKSDFYGHKMKALVLGYIRPELDYVSREALIDDIETDKTVAFNSLARPGYEEYASDLFLAPEA